MRHPAGGVRRIGGEPTVIPLREAGFKRFDQGHERRRSDGAEGYERRPFQDVAPYHAVLFAVASGHGAAPASPPPPKRLCREALPFIYAAEGVTAGFEVGEYWNRPRRGAVPADSPDAPRPP